MTENKIIERRLKKKSYLKECIKIDDRERKSDVV